MGVFTDLYARAKGLDKNAPFEAIRRVVNNDFADLWIQHGDLPYPEGLEQRPAYAILVYTGVLKEPFPWFGQAAPVVGALDQGTNPYTPKDTTIRWLASEAAIENLNPDLENNILYAIHYTPTRPNNNSPAQPPNLLLLGLVDDYNPASLGLTNGANVLTWPSDVGTNSLISMYTSASPEYPTFSSIAFNGEGGVKYDQSFGLSTDVIYSQSSQPLTFFPNKQGTVAIVFTIQTTVQGPALLGEPASFFVSSTIHSERPFMTNLFGSLQGLEKPAIGLSINRPYLFLWWRDNQTIGFRRDGVEKTGITGATNPVDPVTVARWFGDTSVSDSLSITVARIGRWDRLLTESEKQEVEAALMGRYFPTLEV